MGRAGPEANTAFSLPASCLPWGEWVSGECGRPCPPLGPRGPERVLAQPRSSPCAATHPVSVSSPHPVTGTLPGPLSRLLGWFLGLYVGIGRQVLSHSPRGTVATLGTAFFLAAVWRGLGAADLQRVGGWPCEGQSLVCWLAVPSRALRAVWPGRWVWLAFVPGAPGSQLASSLPTGHSLWSVLLLEGVLRSARVSMWGRSVPSLGGLLWPVGSGLRADAAWQPRDLSPTLTLPPCLSAHEAAL